MFYPHEFYDTVLKSDRGIFLRINDLLWTAYEKRRAFSKRSQMKVECHTICRALCLEITDGSIRYVDGNYVSVVLGDEGGLIHRCPHSWLVTESGSIIDPYPLGRIALSPVLIATTGIYAPYAAQHYCPDPEIRAGLDLRDIWHRARILQRYFKSSTTDPGPV